ncbi:AAA family ATPase (plasmid) [Enterococcus faecalis]
MKYYFRKTFSYGKRGIQFIYDNWNDYGYFTLYTAMYLDENNTRYELGKVSFATITEAQNQYEKKATDDWVSYTSFEYLPKSFNMLTDNIISLGSIEYYEQLYCIFPEKQVFEMLTDLNDIAYNLNLYEVNKEMDVINTSFLRGSSVYTLQNQLHRVSRNGIKQIPFNFELRYSVAAKEKVFSFNVDPNSSLPTNVYSLIGNNGTGKTTVIKDIVKCYLKGSNLQSHLINDSKVSLEIHDDYDNETFESILFISFSTFDQLNSEYFDNSEKNNNFKYIGNSMFWEGRQIMKTPKELAEDFINNLNKIKDSPERIILWEKEMLKLSFDTEISTFISDFSEKPELLLEKATNLSSGQKMILLGLSALVAQIDEKTLIIIDEPESYLHPPLVSAYIRILSDILSQKNGVAIIATHSPVILQEIPKNCVWILERNHSKDLLIRHPKIETFGENISVIMDDIFGLDIRNTGFYQFLSYLSEQKLELAKKLVLGNNLGSEANLFMQIFLESEQNA